MTWLPSYLIEERGMRVFQASMILSVVVFVNIPGNIVGGMVVSAWCPSCHFDGGYGNDTCVGGICNFFDKCS